MNTEGQQEGGKIKKEEETQGAGVKWSVRNRIWDDLERHDLVAFPRPCHGRIPNVSESPAISVEKVDLIYFNQCLSALVCR